MLELFVVSRFIEKIKITYFKQLKKDIRLECLFLLLYIKQVVENFCHSWVGEDLFLEIGIWNFIIHSNGY